MARIAPLPLEPRGCTASWDGARLTVAFSGQGVWDLKAELAEKLGLELKHVCVDHAQAERVANAIRAKGVVCVDNWHMRYFPGKQWETRCHAD